MLLVRPGFVIGRMTAGMTPAPLSSTPAAVGRGGGRGARPAVPGGHRVGAAALAVLAGALRLLPRPLWRRLRR